MEIPIELDSEGFLRRECPNCLREFKCFHGVHPDAPAGYEDPGDDRTCPYCGESADPDSWWTQAQAAYLRAAAVHAAKPELDQALRRAVRGTSMTYKPGSRRVQPTPPPEPDDMTLWQPRCHPWEPVKVEGAAARFCFVCGEQAA